MYSSAQHSVQSLHSAADLTAGMLGCNLALTANYTNCRSPYGRGFVDRQSARRVPAQQETTGGGTDQKLHAWQIIAAVKQT